jgi:hypothetical protein
MPHWPVRTDLEVPGDCDTRKSSKFRAPNCRRMSAGRSSRQNPCSEMRSRYSPGYRSSLAGLDIVRNLEEFCEMCNLKDSVGLHWALTSPTTGLTLRISRDFKYRALGGGQAAVDPASATSPDTCTRICTCKCTYTGSSICITLYHIPEYVCLLRVSS